MFHQNIHAQRKDNNMRILLCLMAMAVVLVGCSPSSSGDVSSTPADTSSTQSGSVSEPPASVPPEVLEINWDDYPLYQLDPTGTEVVRVTMDTVEGEIKLVLFPELAPKAVENFVTHAKNGYYDGQIFHRVVNDFMIQGGDPTGTGMGGESIWGEGFEDEFSLSLFNFTGALSMANTGQPSSNGSQFFIVNASPETISDEILVQLEAAGFPEHVIDVYKERGGTPWLDGLHTVFGFVEEGMDVVNAISTTPVDGESPVTAMIINSVTVIEE